MNPSILLAVDRLDYAFGVKSRGLVQDLGADYDFEIIPYAELLSGRVPLRRPALLVAFWWHSAMALQRRLRAPRMLVCLYDGYSTREPADLALFHRTCQGAHVGIANAGFAGRLPAGVRPLIIEDAVDCELFPALPLPARFAVGWTGNGDGRGTDAKGTALLAAACKLASVPLVVQDVSVQGMRPHGEMPAWYAGISVYCCATLEDCEGGPNPVLEALACGRPVVSTRGGLVPQLVEQGAPVAVVPRTVEALAAAIGKFRDAGPAQLSAMGTEARRVALLHDRRAKVGQWRGALQTALAEAPGGVHGWTDHAGVRADVCEIDPTAEIGEGARIRGRVVRIGAHCRIAAGVDVLCPDGFELGACSTLGPGTQITCWRFRAGDYLYAERDLHVGGGGCLSSAESTVTIGRGCLLCPGVSLNCDHAVTIGDEVGMGAGAAVWTHGAWPSIMRGGPASFAPVTIGDRVWIQGGAQILPGCDVGAEAVVCMGAQVTKAVPPGAMVGGVPAKVLKERAYTKDPSALPGLAASLVEAWQRSLAWRGLECAVTRDGFRVCVDGAWFDLNDHTIHPAAARLSDVAEDWRDFIRRRGVRIYTGLPFRSMVHGQVARWR